MALSLLFTNFSIYKTNNLPFYFIATICHKYVMCYSEDGVDCTCVGSVVEDTPTDG